MHTAIRAMIATAAVAASLVLPTAARAAGASLLLSPAAGRFDTEKTFTVTVFVSSDEQAINAVQSTLQFSTELLEVVKVSKQSSIVTLWTQEPSVSSGGDSVQFGGIIPNPGFTGNGGRVLAVTFRGKQRGEARVALTDASVLANDGLGTQVLSRIGDGTYTIGEEAVAPAATKPVGTDTVTKPNGPTSAVGVPTAPIVRSTTHSDPERWYANRIATFTWPLPKGATGVALLKDQFPTTEPKQRSDGLYGKRTLKEVNDGTWFLHVAIRNSVGWSRATHVRFQVDTAVPSRLTVEQVRTDAKRASPALRITAEDEMSGIDRYEIRVDSRKPLVWRDAGDHTFVLPKLKSGSHTIAVEAFDRAGNSTKRTIRIKTTPSPPAITEYPSDGAVGRPFIVRGTSASRTRVRLWLQHGDEPAVLVTEVSGTAPGFTPSADATDLDPDAEDTVEFTAIIPAVQRGGAYLLFASAVDLQGTESKPSQRVVIPIRETRGWFRRWFEAAAYFEVVIAMVVLMLLVVIGWLIVKLRETRRANQHLSRDSRSSRRSRG